MGKRSDYVPKARDKYYTPEAAVKPLASLLPPHAFFCEPCAGNGQLIQHIEELFGEDVKCIFASDIDPDAWWILALDANDLREGAVENCQYIITNPPFTWSVLKPLMDKFISLRPTILLLPADYMHNQRMKPYMDVCVWVKSIGRIKWIEGSKQTGVDNYAWYFFDKNKSTDEPTSFYARD